VAAEAEDLGSPGRGATLAFDSRDDSGIGAMIAILEPYRVWVGVIVLGRERICGRRVRNPIKIDRRGPQSEIKT
jgi:hypothetical protein